MVPSEAEIRIMGDDIPYVSRGGLKLEKALDVFGIELDGRIAVDIGASTGGFSDCMLPRGAKKVYAIDVGYGQLAWKLRTDPRVVNMERTNIRYVTKEQIADDVGFASIDVAFISLEKVLPVVRGLVAPEGEAVALIKPQFEAGRSLVGKKGVVRDPAVHRDVIRRVTASCRENGFSVQGLAFSPVKGPEGNIEYLAYLAAAAIPDRVFDETVAEVVREAHAELA